MEQPRFSRSLGRRTQNHSTAARRKQRMPLYAYGSMGIEIGLLTGSGK